MVSKVRSYLLSCQEPNKYSIECKAHCSPSQSTFPLHSEENVFKYLIKALTAAISMELLSVELKKTNRASWFFKSNFQQFAIWASAKNKPHTCHAFDLCPFPPPPLLLLLPRRAVMHWKGEAANLLAGWLGGQRGLSHQSTAVLNENRKWFTSLMCRPSARLPARPPASASRSTSYRQWNWGRGQRKQERIENQNLKATVVTSYSHEISQHPCHRPCATLHAPYNRFSVMIRSCHHWERFAIMLHLVLLIRHWANTVVCQTQCTSTSTYKQKGPSIRTLIFHVNPWHWGKYGEGKVSRFPSCTVTVLISTELDHIRGNSTPLYPLWLQPQRCYSQHQPDFLITVQLLCWSEPLFDNTKKQSVDSDANSLVVPYSVKLLAPATYACHECAQVRVKCQFHAYLQSQIVLLPMGHHTLCVCVWNLKL